MSRRINESKKVNTKNKHQQITTRKKSKLAVSVFKAFCAVVLITVMFSGFYTSAHNNRTEEPVNFKYYKSVTIKAGDNLWNLAEEYITDDYASVAEYVDVLKKINHLSGDHIQEGQRIIIAYNDTTFIK